MIIYEKENTGITTAQEEPCKYFSIEEIGANLWKGKAFAKVHFWERLNHAQSGKKANVYRDIEWSIVKETSIDAGLDTLFSSESITTTVGDSISLQNPKLVE